MRTIRIRTRKDFEFLEGISAATTRGLDNCKRALPVLIHDFNFNQSKKYVFFGSDLNRAYKLTDNAVDDNTLYYAFDTKDFDSTKIADLRKIGFRWFDDIIESLTYVE